MSFAYTFGRTIGRNKVGAVVVAIITVGFVFALVNWDAPAPPPTAAQVAAAVKSQENAKKAQEAERCAAGARAIAADAENALKAGDVTMAQLLTNPCRPLATDRAFKALLPKIDAARIAADQRQQKADRAEAERIAKAEKARKRSEGVSVGMTKQQVLDSSWGKPQSVNTTTTAHGSSEQWVYGGHNYLYFRDGILTTIQN